MYRKKEFQTQKIQSLKHIFTISTWIIVAFSSVTQVWRLEFVPLIPEYVEGKRLR